MAEGEARRLDEDTRRLKNWKRWGPYLSERQWATVREDYSPDGRLWESFPYEHSIARAYRWGEDGLLGITDRECRLCFALALWNGKDPHLKERLFGLTNPEGNHSEDVKEVYFYLDATPTFAYFKALYKYPQAGISLPGAARGKPAPRTARTRIRADRHRSVRRRSLLGRHGRICEGISRRHPDTADGREPRSGARPAASVADFVVPQHMVVGRRVRRGSLAETEPHAPGRPKLARRT